MKIARLDAEKIVKPHGDREANDCGDCDPRHMNVSRTLRSPLRATACRSTHQPKWVIR